MRILIAVSMLLATGCAQFSRPFHSAEQEARDARLRRSTTYYDTSRTKELYDDLTKDMSDKDRKMYENAKTGSDLVVEIHVNSVPTK